MRKILVSLFATVTSTSRQLVKAGTDFEWSNSSWTHNVFRFYESVFGRKYGIRAEASYGIDEYGKEWHKLFTFEAHVAYVETLVRSFFKELVSIKVFVPVMVTPTGVPVFTSPYLFAIVFDSSALSTETNNAGQSWSHTCTGSNLVLMAGDVSETSTTDVYTGMTYNSASMTAVNGGIAGGNTGTARYYKMWYKTAPSTGSNTVAPSLSVSQFNQGASTSFSGVNQTAPDNSSTGHNTAANPSVSVTPSASNCWIVAFIGGDAGIWSVAGAGTTIRQTGSAPCSMGDSNGVVGSGSPQTLNWTVSSSLWGGVIASLAPSTATVVNSAFFMAISH